MSNGLLQRIGSRIRAELWNAPADQFPGLNGLRGLASYMVTLYHVGMFGGGLPILTSVTLELSTTQRLINGFWIGLDVFFVLSGFLIARILMTSHKRTGTLEFRTFFTRRSFRVFPAYYLVLTFGVFYFTRLPGNITWLLLQGADWSQIRDSAWQNYTYTVNYFFAAGDINAMSWAWSLCIEEQFYLALPLILIFTFRVRAPAFRVGVLISGILIPPLLRAIQYSLEPNVSLLDGMYYRTHNRADEIFYGVLVAYFFVFHHDAFKARVERLGNWTWILGILCIMIVWIFGGLQARGPFAIIAQFSLTAIGSALLITNCLFLQNRFTRVMAHRSWFPAARVSYGNYLIHPYVLIWLLTYLGASSIESFQGLQIVGLLVGVIVISNSLAALMYLIFESRLIEAGRQLGKRWRQPTLSLGLRTSPSQVSEMDSRTR